MNMGSWDDDRHGHHGSRNIRLAASALHAGAVALAAHAAMPNGRCRRAAAGAAPCAAHHRCCTHADLGRSDHRDGEALAALDALCALAERALTLGWCAPEFVEHPCIEILQGRHPVVQARLAELSSGNFIANDTLLGPRQRMQIITGPNMGGKSTYMRQVALIR